MGEMGGRREGGKCEQIHFISSLTFVIITILQTEQHKPEGECCSVWRMLLDVTPSHTHYHLHPLHFVLSNSKFWLLSNIQQ